MYYMVSYMHAAPTRRSRESSDASDDESQERKEIEMTKPLMSKSAAIREATGYVSIAGCGTSYHIYGPYRAAEPRGPSTEVTATSYVQAVRIRSGWRAEIALAMMGRLDEDAHWALERAKNDPYGDHSTRALVEYVIRQIAA